jgi:hypothetical protein
VPVSPKPCSLASKVNPSWCELIVKPRPGVDLRRLEGEIFDKPGLTTGCLDFSEATGACLVRLRKDGDAELAAKVLLASISSLVHTAGVGNGMPIRRPKSIPVLRQVLRPVVRLPRP